MLMHDKANEVRKPFAHQIALYTDDELDHYLGDHGRVVSVQDPENIPPSFAQRLRTTAARSIQNVNSYAVDLNLVAERLQTATTEPNLFCRSPSIATTESLPSQEEQDLQCLHDEMNSYNELVDAGGRPPYPRALLEQFFWTPEKFLDHDHYRDIIMFWRFNSTDRVNFCGCHLLRWSRFRRFQHIVRK
ncbi:hypothetical protein CERZMDRAFT_121589, partial [Cercospora zeae-maydis SCOH1-5]